MVAKKGLTPARVAQVRRAVVDGLAERDIDATVRLERSAMPGLYRMVVTSPDFRRLSVGERQDIVWTVLHERWPRADQLRLSMVLAFSDREAGDAAAQRSTRTRVRRGAAAG